MKATELDNDATGYPSLLVLVQHFRDWVCDRHPGERILVFCHDLVMKAFKVVLLHYDIAAALELALAPPTPNCRVHVYTRGAAGWAFEDAKVTVE